MKLLFITRKHPPAIGGMEKLSYNLTAEIAKKTKSYKIAFTKSQKWLPLFIVYAFFKAGRTCKTKKIDVLHLGDPVLSIIGVLLKKIFKIPVAVTCHGLDLTYNNLIYQKYLDLFLPKLDLCICISKHVQQIAQKRVPADRTVVVPVGVSGDFKYKKKKDNRTLITVGRLVPRKGALWFLENVFMKLPESYNYLIVGNGPMKEQIKECIRHNQLENRVKIISDANDEQVKELCNKSGIFIMPNIKVPDDAEGFGIVALEASAAGLPVIASNIEGIPDAIIDGKNGYLVNEKDAEGFARAIRKAKAPKSFSDYTHKEYSWRKIAEKYIEEFKTLTRH